MAKDCVKKFGVTKESVSEKNTMDRNSFRMLSHYKIRGLENLDIKNVGVLYRGRSGALGALGYQTDQSGIKIADLDLGLEVSYLENGREYRKDIGKVNEPRGKSAEYKTVQLSYKTIDDVEKWLSKERYIGVKPFESRKVVELYDDGHPVMNFVKECQSNECFLINLSINGFNCFGWATGIYKQFDSNLINAYDTDPKQAINLFLDDIKARYPKNDPSRFCDILDNTGKAAELSSLENQNQHIVFYSHATKGITHAAIEYIALYGIPINSPTSKLGDGPIIQHTLKDLYGSEYGQALYGINYDFADKVDKAEL